MNRSVLAAALCLAVLAGAVAYAFDQSEGSPQGAKPRLMTVRDAQNMASASARRRSRRTTSGCSTRAPSRDWDDAQLRTRTHIWRVKHRRHRARGSSRSATRTRRRLTWFPDGSRIAFLSSRAAARAGRRAGAGRRRGEGAGNQVFFMYTDGGEAWPLTKHDGGVSSFTISPDGKSMLFTAQDPLTPDDRRRQRERDDAVVVDETFRWTHLWVVDVETGKEKRADAGQVRRQRSAVVAGLEDDRLRLAAEHEGGRRARGRTCG